MNFSVTRKLARGDKVAILSPSFAAPGKWPEVYNLGLSRLGKEFGLIPVEYPTTTQIGASGADRARDLIAAFSAPEIKGIIATLGGNDQVTWIKNLPSEPFRNNPKPFFGISDNSHLINFLWLQGIPSYYGGTLFMDFAMHGKMNPFTSRFLKHAMFDCGRFELEASSTFNDIDLDWNDSTLLSFSRDYEPSEGWQWDGNKSAAGRSWGGCVESIDEILRHNIQIPSLKDFESVVLFLETSEEMPSPEYVFRVFRGLGERGILERVQALLVGRPKAWDFQTMRSREDKATYRATQRETILSVVRKYNKTIPIIQNLDFGHTDPNVCLPVRSIVTIDTPVKKIFADY